MDQLKGLTKFLPTTVRSRLPPSLQPNAPASSYPATPGPGDYLQYPPPDWKQPSDPGAYPVTPGTEATAYAPPLTPGAPQETPERWTPRTLRTIFLIPVVVIMIGLAIGVEVAYKMALKNNGFEVQGIEKPGAVQFLDSFLPVLIALPLSRYWTRSNEEVLRLQPYVAVSHGNQPPHKTVLLDYISLGSFGVIFKSIRLRHGLVFLSTVILFLTFLFQPLAAALFVVRSAQFEMAGTVSTTSVLGLRPEFADLNAFTAAAGYSEAAVIHGLGDPPFVWEGWSMATFNVTTIREKIIKNGTVLIDAVSTNTETHCVPATASYPTLAGNGSYTVTGTYQNCKATFTSDANAREHFGVLLVNDCPIYGTIPDDKFKPIMFWFLGTSPPAASVIFCSPTVEIFQVVANISVADNTLQHIDVKDKWEGTSNVTSGPPLNGLALNGLYFDAAADQFIAARNLAIQSGLAGSIYRLADRTVGINAALANPDGLLFWTKKIYTQYLAISGKTNFFLDIRTPSPATFVAWQPRLWLDPYATHAFASIFLLTAFLGLWFHFFHTRQRKGLYLAAPVGTVASAVSLTSSAKFGDLLNAYDTEEVMEQKLKGFRFGIDKSTWQIVVEGEKEESRSLLGKLGFGGNKTTTRDGLSPGGRSEAYKGTRQSAVPSGASVPISPLSPGFNGEANRD